MLELWRRILAAMSERRGMPDDLRDEIDAHLAMETEANELRGMSPEEARRAAGREFGGALQIRERAQDAWALGFVETLMHDTVYAARCLAKSPGFTAVAVATLALGIGANSAIFSVVNSVLLNPLPYADSGRLEWGSGRMPNGFTRAAVSPPDFCDYRDGNRSFDSMAAFFVQGTMPGSWSVNGQTQALRGGMVTAGYFETLGFRPVLGRSLTREDEQVETPQVAVLSHRLWQQTYGGNPNALGSVARLDGNAITVVGVMPAGADLPSDADYWFATPLRAKGMQRRMGHMLRVIGHLKPGVTEQAAQRDLDAIARRLGEQFPATNKGWGVALQPMQEAVVGSSRGTLLMLLGAVGLVLLIACVNIANLLLARYSARQREISIRVTLGAGRMRIVRQFLTENLLLAAVAGIAGAFLAWGGVEALRRLGPASLPRLDEVRVDGRVLGFTALLAAATAVLFGLAPALLATSKRALAGLRESGRTGVGRRRHALGGALVMVETAVSICLLIGAGLLVESLYRTLHEAPGFASKNVATVTLMLPKAGGDARVDKLVQRTMEAVGGLPGVQAVGAISELPIHNQYNDTFFEIVEHPGRDAQDRHDEDFRSVMPGYFRTMGIPLLRGRLPDARDVGTAPLVAVVDEPFARRYFPNEDPIGKHLRLSDAVEIVGVVGGVRSHSLQTAPRPTMYLPFLQFHSDTLHLLVRTAGAPVGLAEAIRRIVMSQDGEAALSGYETVDSYLANSVSGNVFNTLLLGLFAVLALILAVAGVYGVFSYIVAQQTQEIGVRMALGARPSQMLGRVLGRGMRLAGAGALLGLLGAYFLMSVLQTELYQVQARDPLAFVGAAGVLLGVALLACAVPARRAMKVDPIVAIRWE